jgi:hypothetical protein
VLFKRYGNATSREHDRLAENTGDLCVQMHFEHVLSQEVAAAVGAGTVVVLTGELPLSALKNAFWC